MYENILIPTDGREGMGKVTEHALLLAELCDATVHVLYVVDDSAYAAAPDNIREGVQDALEGDAQTATKEIAEQALDRDISVQREIRWGDPAVAIISYAIENGIDLIVMGTRGKSEFERYLLGSVSEKIVRVSPIPVLTVNTDNSEDMQKEMEDVLGI